MPTFDPIQPQRVDSSSDRRTVQSGSDTTSTFLQAYARMSRFVASEYSNGKTYDSIIAAAQAEVDERPEHKSLKLHPINKRAVFKFRTLGMIMSLPGGEAFTLGTMGLTDSSGAGQEEAAITLVSVGAWITQPTLMESSVLSIIANSLTAEECVLGLRKAAGAAKFARSQSQKAKGVKGEGSGESNHQSESVKPRQFETLSKRIHVARTLTADIAMQVQEWTEADAAAIAAIVRALQLASSQWATGQQS